MRLAVVAAMQHPSPTSGDAQGAIDAESGRSWLCLDQFAVDRQQRSHFVSIPAPALLSTYMNKVRCNSLMNSLSAARCRSEGERKGLISNPGV